MSAHPLLLTNVRLPQPPAGTDDAVRAGLPDYPLSTAPLQDVLLRHGVVDAVAPAGQVSRNGVEVHDLDGRFLLPGLWDHHVHFSQWTIQQQRLDLSATASAADVLALVRGAIIRHEGGPLVGYGFRDGLWPDTPSTEALDAHSGSVPVILISGDLHCAWANTAGQQLLQITPDDGGLVREDAWFPALERLQNLTEVTTSQYQQVAEAAARRGVVGIVEFENTDNLTAWPLRAQAGVESLRVEVSIWPDYLDAAVARGVKTGDPLDERGLVTVGPLKVIADGSLNTRTAWCWDPYPGMDAAHPHACGMATVPLDQLQQTMATAHSAGIAAAIHAIGDRANTAVLDAFEALGMTGVIEHAQLLRDEDIPRFAALGLAASVQPEHAMDDREVADAYWAGRTGRAFALRSLHEAGAELRLGSDAPVSPLDPWVAMAAATTRTRGDREPWHPEQAIPMEVALASSTRGRTRVRVGDAADLAVVERDPYLCTGDQLRTMPVAATLLGGRYTWFDL
ncbi:amidohydrolase [Nesterenkonia flava]|uniref:Amidohydrolase family protein n=1 Tax=Nesterenkonia flava TaxID=469799 RepID=A0ABU1FTC9_9MICC|nr:amidohydrolase family protein [Nesterenkonia flava]MDR5711921.1 amidohydrolase family protein [Nesterenkonia flava]